MTGSLVQSIDHDDHTGACKCGKYPIIEVIEAGANNRTEPVDKKNCQTFGVSKRDKQ